MAYNTSFFRGQVPSHSSGLSLKAQHYNHILTTKPSVPWFEIHPENLASGTTLAYVNRIRQDYLISFHSVALSLGSYPFNEDHLNTLCPLVSQLQPSLISTHLSWNYHEGVYLEGLLPLPYTEESLQVVADNVDQVQNAFGQKILVENAATYLQAPGSTMDEATFIMCLAKKTGCQVLLDVNNVYVNSKNHNLDPLPYISTLAQSGLVGELHVGGHDTETITSGQDIFLDTHNCPVSEQVWHLYSQTLSHLPLPVPTLIEWDTDVPAFATLLSEQKRAQQIMDRVYAPASISEYS